MAAEAPIPQQKSQATTALVLGILGLVCCGILAPIAWYMGSQELQRIQRGEVPSTNEGMARAGMILGIIGTVFLVLGVIWVLFLGGLTVLSGFAQFGGGGF